MATQFLLDDTVRELGGHRQIGIVKAVEPNNNPSTLEVEWYPSARAEVVSVGSVELLRRSFSVGDRVRLGADGASARHGMVTDVHTVVDAVVLPEKQWVVRQLADRDVVFSSRYDEDVLDSVYVRLENWVGQCEAVELSVRMFTQQYGGVRFTVTFSEDESDVVRSVFLDKTWRRANQDSTYNRVQYYPGQPVALPAAFLGQYERIQWHCFGDRPPPGLAAGGDWMVDCVVVEVEVQYLEVRWINSIPSMTHQNNFKAPPNEITGEALLRLEILDYWEHGDVEMGDRLAVDIPEHRTVALSAYLNELAAQRPEQLTNQSLAVLASLPVDPSSNQGPNHVIVPTAPYCAEDGPPPSYWESVGAPTPRIQGPDPFSSGGIPYGAKKGHKGKKGRRFKTPLGGGGLQGFGDTGGGESLDDVKVFFGAEVPPAGSTVTGEVVFVDTLVTVLWSDGRTEENLPSYRLAPSAAAMKNPHYFLPGNVVQLKTSAPGHDGRVTPVVTPMDGFGIATNELLDPLTGSGAKRHSVNWFQVSGSGATLKAENQQLSAYDLVDHGFWKLFPGNYVVRTLHFPDAGPYVGRVLGVDNAGSVNVRWLDRSLSKVPLSDVAELFADDEYWTSDDAISGADGEDLDENSTDDDISEDSAENEEEAEKFCHEVRSFSTLPIYKQALHEMDRMLSSLLLASRRREKQQAGLQQMLAFSFMSLLKLSVAHTRLCKLSVVSPAWQDAISSEFLNGLATVRAWLGQAKVQIADFGPQVSDQLNRFVFNCQGTPSRSGFERMLQDFAAFTRSKANEFAHRLGVTDDVNDPNVVHFVRILTNTVLEYQREQPAMLQEVLRHPAHRLTSEDCERVLLEDISDWPDSPYSREMSKENFLSVLFTGSLLPPPPGYELFDVTSCINLFSAGLAILPEMADVCERINEDLTQTQAEARSHHQHSGGAKGLLSGLLHKTPNTAKALGKLASDAPHFLTLEKYHPPTSHAFWANAGVQPSHHTEDTFHDDLIDGLKRLKHERGIVVKAFAESPFTVEQNHPLLLQNGEVPLVDFPEDGQANEPIAAAILKIRSYLSSSQPLQMDLDLNPTRSDLMLFNELATLRNAESLIYVYYSRPPLFGHEISEHFRTRVPRLVQKLSNQLHSQSFTDGCKKSLESILSYLRHCV